MKRKHESKKKKEQKVRNERNINRKHKSNKGQDQEASVTGTDVKRDRNKRHKGQE
jgi:hypothetical protein